MKRIAVLVALAALLAGCMFFPMVEGSGILRTSAYPLAGFSKISADQVCRLHVVPDTVFSVTVTCDDNLLPYLVVEKSASGALSLGLEQGHLYGRVTLFAEVHMPALSSLDFSGASEARVEPGFVSTLPLDITLSGASGAQVSGLACGAMSATVSGASTLSARGTARTETVTVSGASSADLTACPAASARVSLSGASDCSVSVGSGPLTLSASGASTLYYTGSPALLTLELSGTSRVVRVY